MQSLSKYQTYASNALHFALSQSLWCTILCLRRPIFVIADNNSTEKYMHVLDILVFVRQSKSEKIMELFVLLNFQLCILKNRDSWSQTNSHFYKYYSALNLHFNLFLLENYSRGININDRENKLSRRWKKFLLKICYSLNAFSLSLRWY